MTTLILLTATLLVGIFAFRVERDQRLNYDGMARRPVVAVVDVQRAENTAHTLAQTRPSGTAAWPSAGRLASESASQRLPEGLPNPRVYSRVPPKIRKVPVNAVFSARWPRPVRHPGVRLEPQSKAPACGRRVAVPSRLPLPAAGQPVEVEAAAAA